MTTRLKGLVVVFDQDIREDDAEALIKAISCMRHVAEVGPVENDVNDYINRERIRYEMTQQLWEVLHPKKAT